MQCSSYNNYLSTIVLSVSLESHFSLKSGRGLLRKLIEVCRLSFLLSPSTSSGEGFSDETRRV